MMNPSGYYGGVTITIPPPAVSATLAAASATQSKRLASAAAAARGAASGGNSRPAGSSPLLADCPGCQRQLQSQKQQLAAAAAALSDNQQRHQHQHHHHRHRQLNRHQSHHSHHSSGGHLAGHYASRGSQVVVLTRPVEAFQSGAARRLPPEATAGVSGAGAAASNGSNSAAATISTLLQVMSAFLIAGFGNVGAGLILDYVKEWPVFLHVNELFILVPSLLGLKGNLEMTMASRLSTQANLGHMDNAHELLKMAKGNLALVQCQATVVSFVVAIFASVVKSMSLPGALPMGGPPGSGYESDQLNAAASSPMAARLAASGEGNNNSNLIVMMSQPMGGEASTEAAAAIAATDSTDLFVERQLNGFDWDNALILCASSLLTANIACFVLGTMMILVIVGSHRLNIDPDNIAAPVAASFGDMTTAALLAVIAHSIYHYSENQRMPYLALVITLLFLGMLPVWWCVAKTNPYTSNVITKGWTPIVIAVFISSGGGFILEYGKSRFNRLPVFQPVINGVGGNLVAVQASRLSTCLHRNGKPGELPANFKLLTGPLEMLLSRKNDINLTTARLLLLLAIPAHLLYFFAIRLIEGCENAVPVTAVFLGLYMLLAVLQVAILLYLAQNLVSLLWRCSIDPDNYSTPLLTATGDLLGCAILLVVFVIAYQFNDPYAMTVV